MSDKKLFVWLCSECGEQEHVTASGARASDRWRRRRAYPGDPEYAVHWHGEEDRGKPGDYVPAEEVEVIPVEQVERLKAALAKAETTVTEQEAGLLKDLERVEAERDEFRDALSYIAGSFVKRADSDEWRTYGGPVQTLTNIRIRANSALAAAEERS